MIQIRNNLFFYLIITNFLICNIFGAQNLDTSFGDGIGYITTQIASRVTINKIKIQSDGKIVVAGSTENPNTKAIIIRYNTDGSLDSSFGTNGIVTANVGSALSTTVFNDIAIQSDGKLVVAGYSYDTSSPTVILVSRYSTSGILDSTFASSGVFTSVIGSGANLNSIVIQPDGNIVVAGIAVMGSTPNALIARLTTTGSLDATFGSGGIVTAVAGIKTSLSSVRLDSLGNIVVTGYYNSGTGNDQFIVSRYTSAGSLDSTFNSSGIVLGSIGNRSMMNSVAVDASNNIIIGGFINFGATNQFAVARYTTSGALDTTFNSPNGYSSTEIGNSSVINDIVIQDDGKIVGAGICNFQIGEVSVARYNTDGTLDSTFGSGGIISLALENGSAINGITLQSDQKIVAGGYLIDQATAQQFANVISFNKNNIDFVNFDSPLAQDAIISTKIPTISGTSSAASAQVQVVINGVVFTTVSTDGSGNWNAGTSLLPVGINSILINLIVASATIVSNEIVFTVVDNLGEDSVFAYSTTTQTSALINTFQSVTLNNMSVLGTWTVVGLNTFRCNVAGKYSISYSAETATGTTATKNQNISVRVVRNGTEISGSQTNNLINYVSGIVVPKTASNNVVLNLSANDTIQFQYATDTSGGGIFTGTGNGTVKPSIIISITRL